MRSLLRAQLRLALGVLAVWPCAIGGCCRSLFCLAPGLADVPLARGAARLAAARGRGLPGAVGLGWGYVRRAERNERDFADARVGAGRR